MKRFVLPIAVGSFAAAVAIVQGPSLYAGQAGSVTLSSWGGGKIVETKDVSLVGGNALKVESTNMFQGGLITFARPVDLSGALGNKENLLAIGVWNMELGGSTSAGNSGGDPGGSGRFGGAGIGGGEGGGGAAPAAQSSKKLSKVRLVIRTSDGKMSEAILPISSSGKWVRAGIPVSVIPGFSKTNKMVSAVAVSGDAPSVFYIGEIAVTTDQTPIQGYLNNTEMNIGKGTEVTLSGGAEAGLTAVEYVWDFNDKDGLQDEALGAAIKHKFRLPGEFAVTLTIRDVYGLKKPWKGSFKVTVNP